MIKEISINFNEQKVELKAYKNYVGDKSLPFAIVDVYSIDRKKVTMDDKLKAFYDWALKSKGFKVI